MKRLSLLLAFLASACSAPAYDVETPPVVYGLDGTSLVEGTSMVIIPYLATDQMAGDTQLTSVDDIRSDDPSIVRLAFTTHLYDIRGSGGETRGVLVYAVHEGSTNLRLYNGGSDEGALPFTVVAAGH